MPGIGVGGEQRFLLYLLIRCEFAEEDAHLHRSSKTRLVSAGSTKNEDCNSALRTAAFASCRSRGPGPATNCMPSDPPLTPKLPLFGAGAEGGGGRWLRAPGGWPDSGNSTVRLGLSQAGVHKPQQDMSNFSPKAGPLRLHGSGWEVTSSCPTRQQKKIFLAPTPRRSCLLTWPDGEERMRRPVLIPMAPANGGCAARQGGMSGGMCCKFWRERVEWG